MTERHEITTLGRFTSLTEIGRGSFGTVFRAVDDTSGEVVALKLLRRGDADSLFRFKREFRVLTELRHPNLVRMHELQEIDGRWVLVMDLVVGVDLMEWNGIVRATHSSDATLDDGDTAHAGPAIRASATNPSPCKDFARVRNSFRQLAEAVAYLHDHGHIHCDLKPAHVLVGSNGKVSVLDFGLLDDEVDNAVANAGRGRIHASPAYASPEQADGRSPTPASDCYAIGVMLFEVLSGRPPFVGDSLSILAAKRAGSPPPDMREWTPDVPADLCDLAYALLSPSPVSRPSVAAVVHALGGSTGTTFTEAASPLIGRAMELDALRQVVAEPAPAVILIGGQAGIGKTTIATHLLNQLRRDGSTLVFSGRCFQTEAVPYKGLDTLIDALGAHLRTLSEPEAVGLLSRDSHALTQLFPSFARVEALRFVPPRRLANDDPQAVRNRAFAALKDTLHRVASRRRVVLFLDDLHWMNGDAIDAIVELILPPEPVPMYIVGAYRNDAACEFVRKMQSFEAPDARARSTFPVHTIPLGVLTYEASREFAIQMLPPSAEGSAAAIARASGGHPLFLRELTMSASSRDQIASLDNLVADRIRRLDSRDRRLLAAVALRGGPCTPKSALLVAGVETQARSLRALFDENLLRPSPAAEGDTVETYHDRIRDVMIALLEQDERVELHRRWAAALVESGNPIEVAFQLKSAGDIATAATYAKRAAEAADRAGAIDQAARLYSETIDLLDQSAQPIPPELLARCGEACLHVGLYPEAAQSLALFRSQVYDNESHLETLRQCAEVEYRRGDAARGTRLLEDALTEAGDGTPERHWRMVAAASGHLARVLWLLASGRLLRPPHQRAPNRRISTLAQLHLRLVEAYSWRDLSRSYYHALSGVVLAERLGESPELVRSLALAGAMASYLGWESLGCRLFDSAERTGQRRGDLTVELPGALLVRAIVAARHARPTMSRELILRAHAILEGDPAPELWRQCNTLALLSEAELALGNIEEAEDHALRLQVLSSRRGYRSQGWHLYCLGQVASRRGDVDQARAAFQAAIQRARDVGNEQYRAMSTARLVLLLALTGEPGTAMDLVASGNEAVDRGRVQQPYCVWHGAALVAAAALRRVRSNGEADSALRSFAAWHCRRGKRMSRRLLATTPVFLAGLAAWEFADRKRQEARALLDQARRFADDHALRGEAYDVARIASALCHD